MSEDNTHGARQIAAVEVFICSFEAARQQLTRLDPNVLSEDAVKELHRLFGIASDWVDRLDRSTRKLLD